MSWPPCLPARCFFPPQSEAKTLVFCSEGNPESLNPQIVTTTTGINAGRPFFNNLVEFPPGSTKPTPALAESWEISDDGLEYTFHLRHGVKFQSSDIFTPTREMNADDVLFSLQRQWKEDHPFHKVGGSNYDYFKDMGMPDLLQSIDKLDDYTVRFRLTHPAAPFLADLAMPFNIIQSAEYGAQLLKAGTPEKIDTIPIGTGPFEFVGFQPDVAVRYRAFADYWGGKQPIDTLVFSITPNASVRLTKLKAGECHVMAFPNPGDRAAIEADPNLKFLQQEGFNIGYLAMNTTKPPFDDVRVRRAVNMAVDKAAIIEAVYQGAGVVAKNPLPPTLPAYNDAIEDYPYDPAAAQQLMIQVGTRRGLRHRSLVYPGEPALRPERQARGRTDPVRSRQDRHTRQSRVGRVECVSAKAPERRFFDGPLWVDRRQRRSRQFPRRAARLHSSADRRQQRGPLVQPRL